jgi:hypothetical protein
MSAYSYDLLEPHHRLRHPTISLTLLLPLQIRPGLRGVAYGGEIALEVVLLNVKLAFCVGKASVLPPSWFYGAPCACL